jgi:hypothetical protein
LFVFSVSCQKHGGVQARIEGVGKVRWVQQRLQEVGKCDGKGTREKLRLTGSGMGTNEGKKTEAMPPLGLS